MNNNSFEITISVKGLEATCNGCTIEDVTISSKGNFGNEYVAILGNVLNNMLAKIPDSTNPCSIEQKNFCEVDKVPTPNTPAPKKTEQRWDLPAIWSCMMSKKPEGFTKTGIGCYTFEAGTITDENKIKVNIEFNEDSIDMDIYMGSSAIHGYLYSDGKRSRITGINPALMNDMIKEMPNEIEEFVKNYFDKIIK